MTRYMLLSFFFIAFENVQGLGLFGISDAFEDLDFNLESQAPPIAVTESVFPMRLDHFNKSDSRYFNLRVLESLDLWQPNGTIYIRISGQREANPKFITSGLIYELAKETHGVLIMPEHRFYGKSLNSEANLNVLEFLSSRQALADIATHVKNLKDQEKFKHSKIVAIGCSYAGNLAAWMKLLYPHLIDAAIASCAPVLAKLDFYEFLETVSDDFKKYGTKGCWNYIRDMFQRYEEAFKTHGGIKQLVKEENICKHSEMNKPENQQLFIHYRAVQFQTIAEYGNLQNITSHCEKIMNTAQRTNKVETSIVNPNWNNSGCLDVNFDKEVESIKNCTRCFCWLYQRCTEFSFAKSTTSKKQPFTNLLRVESFYKLCSIVFGEKINGQTMAKAVEKTNSMYGGLKPELTKVIFVNGELDPWHRLGILKDLSKDVPAIFIPKVSHCRDLQKEQQNEPTEMKDARQKMKKTIKNWLGLDD